MENKIAVYAVRITRVSGNQNSAGSRLSRDHPFSALLTETIDRTLTELLGARVSQALWNRMRTELLLGKDDVPQHVGKLATFLEDLMGTASKTVERRILKRLYAVLQHEFPEPLKFDFAQEIEKVRILWEKRQ